MGKRHISVNGEAYPCYPTMGAMLRFKQETGKEVTEITKWGFSDLCAFLWCCVVSASKREGKNFNLSLMDFADSLSPEDMEAWTEEIMVKEERDGNSNGEKKKQA